MKKEHESYGMIQISKYNGSSEFFGSDVSHNGGVSITISKAVSDRDLSNDWYHSGNELIRVRLSSNQYVSAITSGMNTTGVPCTIERFNNNKIEQINHITNKKEQFVSEMEDTQEEFKVKINKIIEKLDGNIGKRKSDEIKKDLEVLRNHISSNTNFVLKCFNEAMEKTIVEAKHSISNYIDSKVHSLGLEAIKEQLQVSIDKK